MVSVNAVKGVNVDAHKYLDLKEAIINESEEYASDIAWAENVGACSSSDHFLTEYIFVVCNSGMKAQIAVKIFARLMDAMKSRTSLWGAFKHPGKLAAIGYVWAIRNQLFTEYIMAKDKLEFCKSLPWIGDITKYHLYKNLGGNCVKPDRHLVRIAEQYGTDCFTMCQNLSDIIGDRVGTVDYVIWRAANLRMI